MPPQQPPRQQFRPPPQQPKQWPGGPRNGMMNGGRDMGLGRPMPGVAGGDMGMRRPPAGPAMNNGYGGSYNASMNSGGMGHMPSQGYNNNSYNGPLRPPPKGMSNHGGFVPNQPRTQPPPAPFGLRAAVPPPPFALAGGHAMSGGTLSGVPLRPPHEQQPYHGMPMGNGAKRQVPPIDHSRDAKRPRGSDHVDHLPYGP